MEKKEQNTVTGSGEGSKMGDQKLPLAEVTGGGEGGGGGSLNIKEEEGI